MSMKQIISPIEYWNDGKTRIISPEDENGRKIEIGYFFGVEFTGDTPLDKHAITGTMFFKDKEVYLSSLSRLYENNTRTNGEFYIDNLINEAIRLGYIIKNFEVDDYICWGTPNDLETYRYWQTFFNKVNWHPYDYNTDYFTN